MRARFFSSKPALKNRSTIFTLGNRGHVLTAGLEAPIVVPHAAQKVEQRVCWYAVYQVRCYVNPVLSDLAGCQSDRVCTHSGRPDKSTNLRSWKFLNLILAEMYSADLPTILNCPDSIQKLQDFGEV